MEIEKNNIENFSFSYLYNEIVYRYKSWYSNRNVSDIEPTLKK